MAGLIPDKKRGLFRNVQPAIADPYTENSPL